MNDPSSGPEICIVGAGMSGIAMGVVLKKAGIHDFRIFEKSHGVGGTWRENRYPGLTCDVPSFFYSYSFEPRLDWSHRFSPGPEIRAYFEGVTEKYGLLEHISFGEPVESARFEGGMWEIETGRGERLRSRVLIAATGPLHHPHRPEIPGLEDFEGALFHSAEWDEDVPLEGRRIGVIGNGSTGVQMMEPLSELASELTLFQRTAQWIYPVGNVRYSEKQKRRKRRFPFIATLTRAFYKRMFELTSVAVVEEGRLRRNLAKGCRDHLATVEDPELRRKLTPDYEPGCKRLIMSRTFYPTMQKENVHLETSGIERIERTGVRTTDGVLHELDVLLLATGFRAHAWGIDTVVGADGLSLKEAWAQGTRTYKSIGVPGFPDFFMLVGPNSPIGNISVIDVSETQAGYILDCIQRLRRTPGATMEPRRDATEAFHAELLEAMKGTVWVTGCNSWYLDEDGVPTLWPWSAGRFHREMRHPDFSDYEIHAPR